MAQTDRDVFDKVGQYNLSEIAIISYRHSAMTQNLDE